MDSDRFDALVGSLAAATTRRRALGLVVGVTSLWTADSVAKQRRRKRRTSRGSAQKKTSKVTICHRTHSATQPFVQLEVDANAIPAHEAHGDTIDPDFQNDREHCGSCGTVCTGGGACTAPTCQQGSCATSPRPGAECDSGTGAGSGTCDASGQCQPNTPHICSGKASANPCFERDGAACNAAGTCNCGVDINGGLTCFENAYCNSSGHECASNADCVAMGFPQGSVCFSATNCCLSQTGCTTPCPS